MNKWFLARVGLIVWSFVVMILTTPPEQTSDKPAVFGLPEAAKMDPFAECGEVE